MRCGFSSSFQLRVDAARSGKWRETELEYEVEGWLSGRGSLGGGGWLLK